MAFCSSNKLGLKRFFPPVHEYAGLCESTEVLNECGIVALNVSAVIEFNAMLKL